MLTALGSFFNKKGSHNLEASASQSALFDTNKVTDGYQSRLALSKVNGNWVWWALQQITTDDFNMNDLGFQPRNNRIRHKAEFAYRTTQPQGPFNKYRHAVWGEYRSLYKPYRFEEFYVGYDAFHLTKSFFAFGINLLSTPGVSYNYFEPRAPGRWFKVPGQAYFSGFISTDYRKVLALDMNGWYYPWFDMGREEYGIEFRPRVRLGDHFFTTPKVRITNVKSDYGYVPDNDPDLIYFGKRNQYRIENIINAQYVFTPKSSLTLQLRHAYADIDYLSFYILENNGDLTAADLDDVNDLNFNTFNIEIKYSWWFAPGSGLVILYRNSAASVDNYVGDSYIRNLEGTFDAPVQNNISLRLTYFLDYNMVTKGLRNKKETGHWNPRHQEMSL
ncbi:MAG: hypothetical protein GWP27_09625 [Bacteroidetes bacterium]|nr:hypothetical protein [Bacteroidota bacterium]